MFEFEKLIVYSKAKNLNQSIARLIDQEPRLKPYQRNQLARAAFSVVLNIAEGTGRFTKPSKRNFYIIARGSVFECVAILDIFQDQKLINSKEYRFFYQKLDELSRILYKMIGNLE